MRILPRIFKNIEYTPKISVYIALSIDGYIARTAVRFYLKNQYELKEEPFNEDGILHRKMRKMI